MKWDNVLVDLVFFGTKVLGVVFVYSLSKSLFADRLEKENTNSFWKKMQYYGAAIITGAVFLFAVLIFLTQGGEEKNISNRSIDSIPPNTLIEIAIVIGITVLVSAYTAELGKKKKDMEIKMKEILWARKREMGGE